MCDIVRKMIVELYIKYLQYRNFFLSLWCNTSNESATANLNFSSSSSLLIKIICFCFTVLTIPNEWWRRKRRLFWFPCLWVLQSSLDGDAVSWGIYPLVFWQRSGILFLLADSDWYLLENITHVGSTNLILFSYLLLLTLICAFFFSKCLENGFTYWFL